MDKLIYIFIFSLQANIFLCAQDTIFLEKSKIYNADEYRYLKNRYSKELIQVTIDSFKIEQCYYIFEKKIFKPKERKRIGNLVSTYKITGDSILEIIEYNNYQKWNYMRISDTLYSVESLYENGFVNRLIPFTKHGEFTFHKKKDTLITRNYKNGRLINYLLPKSKFISDTIFKHSDVDVAPVYSGGKAALSEFIKSEYIYPNIARESQISGRIYVKFVVSNIGEIKNIKIIRGVDPIVDSEALRTVSAIKGFKPGIKNGKAVNVEMIIPVEYKLE